MQFKKWLFTSFGLILLFLTFWCILNIAKILKNHPDDDLSQFLPKSTKYAVRIYANNIVKTCFEELLFYKKDGSTQEKFQEFAQQIISKTDSVFTQTENFKGKFQGVDIYNDIIFFEFIENKTAYSGILCHVTDSIKFNKSNNDKDFIKLSKQSIGIVLQQVSGQKNSVLQIASNLLKSNGTQKLKKKRNSTNALLDIYLSVNDGRNELSEINMEVNADPHKINITGNINPYILKSSNTSSYHLQPKNLNICLKYIPDQLNSEIGKWFDKNKFPKLKFEEMQINYEGLDIGFSTTNLAVNPKFEAIFKTKNEFKIREYLSDTTFLKAIGGELDSAFVSINNTQYFFEQLDSCSFYIGNNHMPMYEKRSISDPLSIRGKLSHITNIQTGGMDFLLNIVPFYTSLNNYFLKLDKFNFKITQDAEQNNFSGSIDFKAGSNAFFESLLLLTEFQELKTLLK